MSNIWRILVLATLCGCARPLMEVGTHVEGADLLINGGFQESEGAFSGWEGWEDGYEVGKGRRSSQSVYCRNDEPLQRGLGQTLVLDQKRPASLLVSGWSRAREVSGGRSTEYSLYVDLTYDDGEEVWGQHAPFDTGTHDWQEQRLLIRPAKPIRELKVYGLFRGHIGEAWFDDFAVHELEGGGMATIDGLPVTRGSAKVVQGKGTTYASGDGLALGYVDGQIFSLQVEGRELADGGTVSGFMVRDVAAESGFFGFEGDKCRALDLKLQVEVEEKGDHIRIAGQVVNTAGKERAITLVFALPVSGTGWRWHEDVRSSQAVEGEREYVNAVNIGTGATGDLALYPWMLIENGETGLMLGVDMGKPAQYRLGYSGGTGQLYVAYDFGLTEETESFPNAAPFAFVVARTEPEWGFRAAAAKYYGIYRDEFARRSPEQGIWMPFTDVSTVAGWEEFGFKYHEGINNVPFDDEAGVLSFRYTEPSTWWMRMAPEVPRTHEGVMQVLGEKSAAGDRRARAIEISGSHDGQERLQYQIKDEPWCDGAVFSSNPSPHLGEESEGRMNWNEEEKERLYGAEAEGEQDGEYLDSVEGYVTATENFRRDHFRRTRVPLTFSTVSKKPVIHKSFSVWEFATWMAESVRGMDRLMFGNAVPHRFAFLAPAFDIMGTESNWLHGEDWQPPADSWFNFRRTMCHQKPYLLLMNTDYDRLVPELVEKYFQRCLFYGFFPSMFSHNAAENPYWQTPRWYERDRHLFKQYIPLIRQVAEAGWEPITGARTSEPRVWLERFGKGENGDLFITVINSSAGDKLEARIELLAEWIGNPAGIVELTGGNEIELQRVEEKLFAEVELEPEEVLVLKFEYP